jgi:hypothetical protein
MHFAGELHLCPPAFESGEDYAFDAARFHPKANGPNVGHDRLRSAQSNSSVRRQVNSKSEAYMPPFRYRLIDTAGGEIGIITDSRPLIQVGDGVQLPDGSTGSVVDVYDDEDGKEGNVQATLAVEE